MACNTKQPVRHCCGCFLQSLWIFQQERSRESKRACHPWNHSRSCCSVHFRINLTLDNRVRPLLISFAVSFFIFLPLAAGYQWSIFEELTVLSMIIKSRGHDTDFGVKWTCGHAIRMYIKCRLTHVDIWMNTSVWTLWWRLWGFVVQWLFVSGCTSFFQCRLYSIILISSTQPFTRAPGMLCPLPWKQSLASDLGISCDVCSH